MATADGSPLTDDNILGLLAEGSDVCRSAGRGDLGHVLEIAAARLRRPSTVVCVVGEYKQGKSEVVNALAGRDICPADDDIATSAITVIGHGAEAAAFLHRSENGQRIIDAIEISDVPRFAAETGDADLPVGIDMVEVTIPSVNLERGLALVDTPGVNALRSGADRAVLEFLHYADCLILVTDASAELSPPELRFLAAAREVCPAVLVTLSKIDLYPEWRRIAEFDTGHLSTLGLDDALIPISSALQMAGLEPKGSRSQDESGFGDLLTAIEERVLAPARLLGEGRAIDELTRAIRAITSAEIDRLAALEDRRDAEQRLGELQEAQRAIALMHQTSSKWVIALNDGMADIRANVDYRLRSVMRDHLQDADRRLTESKPEAVWSELCVELRASLGEEVDGIFEAIRQGAAETAGRIAEMIADDVAASWPDDYDTIDVERLWSSEDRQLTSKGSNVLGSGLTILRGGYSGMLMLGMLGQLAGMAALGGVTLGVGALFGVKQFRDERRRHLDRQRQEARAVMRQFLEQVQFELGSRVQRAIQETHRRLRDHFGDRIQMLSTMYASSARQLEEALEADEARRSQLTVEAKARIDELSELAARLPTGTASER